MTLGLIGRKLGMTRIYDDKGAVCPVTIIQAGPCPIIQVKRQDTDGYTALQVGYETLKEKKVNKPTAGHFKSTGVAPQRFVREFRIADVDGYEVGSTIGVDVFAEGERVDVVGISKGRGWSGPMKRHHLSRGPESHGSMYHRRSGSMGASSDPSRVWKGKKLPGQLGNERSTTQNIRIVKVDPARNLLMVLGSVPGHNNAMVMIKKAIKRQRGAAAGKK